MQEHAPDCQSHIVDRSGRPDECTCGAEERTSLADRLRGQAVNVEGDGWLNAARYMRQAADWLDVLPHPTTPNEPIALARGGAGEGET